MYCKNCGCSVTEETTYCPSCGQRMAEEQSQTPGVLPSQNSVIMDEAESAATRALIWGILSLVIGGLLGFIFSFPARRNAETYAYYCDGMSGRAKVGYILGKIGFILGLIYIIVMPIYIIAVVVMTLSGM